MSGSYFKEHLYYETKRDNSAGSYNGNISQQDIQYRAGGYSNLVSLQFDNTYDQLNRLTNSSIENNFSRYGEALSYDKHGNITNLARGGISVHNWTSGSVPTPNHTFYDVDQLNYTYNGNQVKSISDNSSGALYSGAQDFKDNASTMDEYGYDANGNLTKDLNKKIVTIRYNSLNLPDTIQFQSGHMVSYVYEPMGQKESVTRKVVATSGISIPVGKTLSTAGIAYTSTTSVTKYASNVVYGGSSGSTITDILLPGGLLKPISTGSLTFNYNYYIRDHLGNVRAVIDGTGTIKQVNNYNAFGMEYGESADNQTMATYQNYLYGGKEFDRKLELNLYDFGARFLDATRGQWTTPDPLAEKRPWISPYAYCSNNPMNRIDPDGRLEWPVNGTYNGNGRRHENNWNASRPYGRLHQGVDVNHTGGGNTDQGAPIVATHNGTVTKIGSAGDGDGGGNRIKISSTDGTVSTSYMHLDAASSGLKVGSEIKEGQQIGTMGRSGANGQSDYTAHLHYEVSVDGTKINPANGENHLVNPQQIIDSRTPTQQPEYSGGTLPEVTVVGQSPEATQRPLPQIPVTEIRTPEIRPIQN